MKYIAPTKLRNVSLLAILALMLVSISCNDNVTRNVPTDDNVDLDIKTVKSYYHGEAIPIDKDNNFKKITIQGTLISDPEAGNAPKGYLVLQEENSGVALLLKDSTDDIAYTPGEVLQVNVQKGVLKKINGNLVIAGVSQSDITQTGKRDSIEARSVTLKQLADNFDEYNESLVKVNLVDLVPEPSSGETYGGAKGLNDGSANTGSIKLFTFPDSKLANKEVHYTAAYTGIAMYGTTSEDNGAKQIWMRNGNDIGSINIIPSQSPFIITGFLANPTGWDQINPGPGYHPDYLPRPVEGGFEYIQFMALKDIDFSETPFSLVLMLGYPDRPAATADGWTAGKFRTVKFNLTSGTAKKGTFFYVGSGEELIDGFSPDGFSTSITDANFIYSKTWWTGDYDDTLGDPFSNGNIGHVAKGWLDQRDSPGSDAIAIFEGTEVTPTSVPVDAVFFNEEIGGTLNKDKGWGFLVPDNDLYNPVDPKTGDSQPLFGEGTNTYAVPLDIVKGNGVWVALGGMVNTKGFISKRNDPTGIQLYVEPGKSHLSDIEEGKGVTVFRK